ncbi:MAG: DUF4249 domain-containing protein [Dysgonamonadaceae bacterium]|jgi:hypothetical protein|nr:DUF4249 domain-containing protein [Dysgonamonadaceae bacterium]
MKIVNVFVCIFLALFLISCEKEISFSGERGNSVLVLNGILTADSVVRVHLSESRFFLDNDEFKTVDDAVVRLWKNGFEVETLDFLDNGWYESDFIAGEGDSLMIDVLYDGHDVRAETVIVKPVQVLGIDTVSFSAKWSDDVMYYSPADDKSDDDVLGVTSLHLNFDLDLVFDEPADEKNFYDVRLYVKFFYYGYSIHYPLPYILDDPVLNMQISGEDDTNYGSYSHLFNDELINGKQYSVNLKLEDYYCLLSPFYLEKGDPVSACLYVELVSLTEPYYLFGETSQSALGMEDGFAGMVSEPVRIYSNVDGGIGLLGSYGVSSANIFIPRP